MSVTHITRRAAATLMLAALGLLAACSIVNVSTELAPNASFSGRKTYAWVPNPQAGGTMDASIAGQQIHVEVDQALAVHGFQKVASGQAPDMLVDYRVIVRQETDLMGGPGWGGVTTNHYTEGTFIVTLENPKDGYFLWRGVAQSTLDELGSPKEGQAIQTAVQKMFLTFPN